MTEALEVILAPNLSALKGIKHGFFSRKGGVSEGLYQGLNCGLGSDDVRENVLENRARVAHFMGLKPLNLVSVYQVHSADALVIDAPFPGEAPKADGLVTKTPDLGVCALSADCGQILLADEKAGVVGACHAGWKGALSGIIEATVAKMEEAGAERHHIHAALGPCLSQKNYQVGEEFEATFMADNRHNARFFAPSNAPDKRQFDLPSYIESRFMALNMASHYIAHICTYEDKNRFFSYRRTTHAQEKDYGRLLSCIKVC
jgi:YfiH family protein